MSKASKKASVEIDESARSSFIPEAESEPAPHVTNAVQSDEETPRRVIELSPSNMVTPVSLRIHKLDDRQIEITLTVPPLAPCVERKFLPMKYSPEELASITADAIRRAAESARADGIHQHARKQREEAEAKARFEKR